MDAMTREALTHVQEAMREFLALMSMEQPSETQARYDLEKFILLTQQFDRARSEAIPPGNWCCLRRRGGGIQIQRSLAYHCSRQVQLRVSGPR